LSLGWHLAGVDTIKHFFPLLGHLWTREVPLELINAIARLGLSDIVTRVTELLQKRLNWREVMRRG